MSAAAQQYCLRWNNHRTNLLTVFDELLQNEAFTDVTLVCEGGNPIKCHRMVLAACSPYFQNLFTDLPCKHPVVVLKDVKYSEIKAILEYMYRGEVNVAQDQLAALLRVAEALKVKGLVEEKRSDQQPPLQRQISPPPTHHQQDQQQQLTPHQLHNMRHRNDEPMDQSPSAITTSTSSLPAPTVHSSSTNSPPHSTNGHFGGGGNSNSRNHYAMYGKAPSSSTSSMMERKMNLPIWAVPGLPMPQHHSSPIPTARSPHSHAIAATAAAAMLNSCYNTSEADLSSHMRNRKKMPSSGSATSSTVAMNRDTPILRTVLGQGQVDSSQPVSLVCHSDSHDLINSNSNGVDDLKPDKHIKNEPLEDAQSPFTDLSPSMDEEKFIKMGLQSSSPQQSYCNISSGIATYVPSQKPEWKRYKQYTRNDIMSAIEAVRNGMSALQAARKYGVPSRTLYDKVKKLGITTSRPFKRGSNGSSGSGFSFSQLSESEEHSLNNNSSNALIEATSSFLQHALDGHRGPSVGGSMGAGNIDEREALAAMAAAAAARAAVMSGHSSSPRSPSPRQAGSSGKPYMHQSGSSSNSLTPSPPGGGDLLHHSHHHHHHHHSETNGSSERDREDMEEEEEEEYDDQQQVEDLSVGRRQQTTPPPQSHSPQLQQQQPLPVASQESRVIMPPMNISSILKKEELLKESIMEDMRREVKVDEAP